MVGLSLISSCFFVKAQYKARKNMNISIFDIQLELRIV